MIIFDSGHTLLFEPNHNTENGNRALYKYIKSNPKKITFEEYNKAVKDIFENIKRERVPGIEIHEHFFLKTLLEYLDIELSVSLEEAERIIWYGIYKGEKLPHVDELLDYLNKEGIRTGVISNLCFSGGALKERLNRFLPQNKFEFVLASSEYIFCKPNTMMFDIALNKSGLSADKVWFCGDSILSDVYGAHNSGMFPVLYNGETGEENDPIKKINDGIEVPFEHLYVEDWRKFIDLLEKIITI